MSDSHHLDAMSDEDAEEMGRLIIKAIKSSWVTTSMPGLNDALPPFRKDMLSVYALPECLKEKDS